MMFGSVRETSMSSRRPPMLAGPTDRKLKDERTGFDEMLKGACCGAPPPRCASAAETATIGRTAAMARQKRGELCIPGVVLGWGVRPVYAISRAIVGSRSAQNKTGRSPERPVHVSFISYHFALPPPFLRDGL